MAIKIKLKNSVVENSVPTTSHIEVGEPALNLHVNSLGLYVRASDNSIVKLAGPGSITTPAASTTLAGISEYATNAETTTGTATDRTVTPAGLKAVTDAERTTSDTNYLAKSGGTLSNPLVLPNASAAAPALTGSDTDSGVYFATNTVYLSAGGTTRLTADANGLGIGTTGTSGFPLSILSAGSTGQAIVLIGDATNEESKIVFRNNANDANKAWIKNDGYELDLVAGFGGALSFQINSSEKARVDSSGRLLVGHSSSIPVGSTASASLQTHASANVILASFTGYSTNSGGAHIVLGKSRGANGTPGTAVWSTNGGDNLGGIRFAGDDGTDIQTQAALIVANVDGTVAENQIPGELVFSTANSTGAMTPALTVSSSQSATFAASVSIDGDSPSSKLKIGDGQDLEIYHYSDTNYIDNLYSSELFIRGAGLRLKGANHTDLLADFIDGGACKLYFDAASGSSPSFETTATGAKVTGEFNVVLSSSDTSFTDESSPGSTGGGLVIKNLQVANGVYSALTAVAANVNSVTQSASFIAKSVNPGYAPEIHLTQRTGSNQQTTALKIDENQNATFAGDISLANNKKLLVGTDGSNPVPLQIYHNGTHSSITNFKGNIHLAGQNVRITNANFGETFISCDVSDAVKLFYGGDSTAKLQTTASGVKIAGAADTRLTLGSGGTDGTNDSVHVRADGVNLNFMAASGGITKFEVNGTETLNIAANGNASFAGDIKLADTKQIIARGADNSTYGELDIKVAAADDSGSANVATFKKGSNSVINLAFPSGGGIDFSATADGGTVASGGEILDDYEEGTWTPTIVGTGANGGINGTQSYHSSTHGSYTKIGNLVHCSFRVDFDGSTGANGSPNGSYIVLEGLPFNLAADPDNTSISTPIYYVNLGANYIMLGLQGNTSSNYAFVWAKKSATASREYLSIADVEDNSELTGTISYRV